MALITIAKITKPNGLTGKMRAYSMTSFPKERFKVGTKLYLSKKGSEPRPVTLNSVGMSLPMLVLGFKEITTAEEAETLRDYEIQIEEEKAPLPEDTYRIKDLVGCKVVSDKGEELGVLTEVLQYGPTDTFRIKREGQKDFFVPFVFNQFVQSVNIQNKQIVITVVDGML